MRVASGFRRQQRTVQRRPARGEYRDALVPILVRGRHRNAVVPGQRRHPGIVQEPAQHQHGLLVGAQHAGSLAGTTPQPLGVQQTDRNKTLSSDTSRTAVYATLIQRRTLYEVDLW